MHVYDSKALYNITIKDQDIWLKNRAEKYVDMPYIDLSWPMWIVCQYSVNLLGPGIIIVEGAQHRKQRKMLTPVFSAAYLRGITPVFYETIHKVRGHRDD